MLYAYIDGTYTEVITAKMNRGLNKAGSVTLTVPIVRFPEKLKDFRNVTYTLYFKNQLMVAGGVIESAVPSTVTDPGDTFTFQGTDELGLLTQRRGKSNATYQNQPVLFVINDLLRKVPNWRLGYTEGLVATDRVTINVNNKDTIFAQLNDIISNVPNCNFRYGGFVEGVHTLDIGQLQQLGGITFTQGQNTIAIKKTPPARKTLYEIEGFGGLAGTREVYLSDAVAYDPTLATHARYPVIDTGDGWVVRDLLFPTGDSILKQYTSIKPASAMPTVPEINEAGYALWQSCVNEFVQSNTPDQSFDVEVSDFPYVSDLTASTTVTTEDSGSQTGGGSGVGRAASLPQWAAQGFKCASGILTALSITLGGVSGTPTGNMVVEIRSDNAGRPSSTILKSVTFTPVINAKNSIVVPDGPLLSAATTYWLLLRPELPQINSNFWVWQGANPGSYPNGQRAYTDNNGATWTLDAMDHGFTVTIVTTVPYVSTTENSGLQTGVLAGIGNSTGILLHRAQSFTCAEGRLTQFTFSLGSNFGSPTGGLTWEIRTNNGNIPSNIVLATGTIPIPIASASNTATLLDGPILSAGTTYWIVLRTTVSQALNNGYRWNWANPGTYANGSASTSSDDGASWATNVAFDATFTVTTEAYSGLLIPRAEYTGGIDISKLIPGNLCVLQGRVRIPTYSWITQTLTWEEIFDVNSYEQMADIDIEFTTDQQIKVGIKTGYLPEEDLFDPEVLLAKGTAESKDPMAGVGYALPVSLGVTIVTDTQSNVIANTTFTTGELGRLFSLPMPVVPMGTTNVYFSYYTNTPNAVVETIQSPALPTAGFIGRIRVNDGWTVNNSVTLKGVFIFT